MVGGPRAMKTTLGWLKDHLVTAAPVAQVVRAPRHARPRHRRRRGPREGPRTLHRGRGSSRPSPIPMPTGCGSASSTPAGARSRWCAARPTRAPACSASSRRSAAHPRGEQGARCWKASTIRGQASNGMLCLGLGARHLGRHEGIIRARSRAGDRQSPSSPRGRAGSGADPRCSTSRGRRREYLGRLPGRARHRPASLAAARLRH